MKATCSSLLPHHRQINGKSRHNHLGPLAFTGHLSKTSQQTLVSVDPLSEMVVSFRVFKKNSTNGKISVYLGKRDFADSSTNSEPIDGVVTFDPAYLNGRKIFGQIFCNFRYGREQDETMGLSFERELCLVSEELFPTANTESYNCTRLQEVLLKRLSPESGVPFTFRLPSAAPCSVTLHQITEQEQSEGKDRVTDHEVEHQNGYKPCGVQYRLVIFVAASEQDEIRKHNSVTLNIRKIQTTPCLSSQHPQPSSTVTKDFMLSAGDLELEVMLDKPLYHHGDHIPINICIRNHSNKCVRRIRASVLQEVSVGIFSNGSYKNVISSVETEEPCPIEPGQSVQRVFTLSTTLTSSDRSTEGKALAVTFPLTRPDSQLASSTLYADPENPDVFGINVAYSARVKLMMGPLAGDLIAEVPFLLMEPRHIRPKIFAPAASCEQLDLQGPDSFDQLNLQDSDSFDQLGDQSQRLEKLHLKNERRTSTERAGLRHRH